MSPYRVCVLAECIRLAHRHELWCETTRQVYYTVACTWALLSTQTTNCGVRLHVKCTTLLRIRRLFWVDIGLFWAQTKTVVWDYTSSVLSVLHYWVYVGSFECTQGSFEHTDMNCGVRLRVQCTTLLSVHHRLCTWSALLTQTLHPYLEFGSKHIQRLERWLLRMSTCKYSWGIRRLVYTSKHRYIAESPVYSRRWLLYYIVYSYIVEGDSSICSRQRLQYLQQSYICSRIIDLCLCLKEGGSLLCSRRRILCLQQKHVSSRNVYMHLWLKVGVSSMHLNSIIRFSHPNTNICIYVYLHVYIYVLCVHTYNIM